MVEFMKKVAALNEELTVEERNLISVAYKNVIGARRASWRIISSLEAKEEGSESNSKIIQEYRKKVTLKSVFLNEYSSVLMVLYCVLRNT